ncbi:AAA family ATPase [Actinokineospora fastidiosa]|uniref:AAA family ATPase n=1 Tax=Actinokineospora fastidiosa TaxID=1816 RepID=A0A918LBT9_9PSEU|nr:histone-like nucleoid-structuring protein Lsr2 [Actinokineospora fastidiosa]GGS29009.1 hypothetical protein GCM10010171_22750 [Actinokineospora fastidiosa]
MRVRNLCLERYGAFEDRSVDFGSGLTLVLGDNEAGKSTTLDAFADVLWAIPNRSSRAFRHVRQALALRAVLELPDGDELRVVRKAAHLVDSETGESVAEFWRGDGDSREKWVRSFGLSHAELRSGGKALIEGAGDLAELVFRARSGYEVGQVLDTLTRQADELFKAHGNAKKSKIRTTLRTYEDATRAVNARVAAADEVDRVQKAIAELTEAIKEHKAALQERQADLRRWQSKRSVAESIRAIAVHQEVLAEVRGAGPCLSAVDLDQWHTLNHQLHSGEAEVKEKAEDLAAKRLERTAVVVDDAIRADREVIARLTRDAGQVLRERHTAEELRRSAAAADDEARQALAGIIAVPDGCSTAELLGQVWLGEDRVAELNNLAAQLATANDDLAQRSNLVAEAEGEAASFAAPDTAPQSAVAAVREALHAVRDSSSACSISSAARDKIVSLMEERATELRSLDLPASTRLGPLPNEIELHQARQLLGNLTGELDRAEQAVTEADNAMLDAETALRNLGPRDLADPAALESARQVRDELVAEAMRSWLGGHSITSAPHLPVEVERAVARADELADRLADDQAEATEHQRFREHLERAIVAADQARDVLAEVRRDKDEAQCRWDGLWSGTGVPAPPPDAAAQYRAVLAGVLVLDSRILTEQERLAQVRHEVDRQLDHLTACLAEAGRNRQGADLSSLLRAAEELVEHDDAAREARAVQAQQSERLRKLRAQRDEAEMQRDRLKTRWQKLVPAGELTPVGWARRLELVDQARAAHSRATAHFAEAEQAQQRFVEFSREVDTLAARHRVDLTDVRQRCDELQRRLDEAETAAAAASTLDRLIADLQRKRDSADRELGTLREALDALVSRLAVDDLHAAAQRGAQVIELEKELRTAEDRVRSAIPGADVEALVAELAALDDDTLDLEVAQAEDAVAEVDGARSDAQRRLGQAQQEHRELLDRPEVAELQLQAEQHAAVLAEQVEEYLTTVVQRDVLARELRRYEAKHVSPLLEEAGRLLERLTSGRYVALQTHVAGSDRYLRIVDAEGSSRGPETLSEGTADQVYLALRLAGIRSLQVGRRAQGLPTLPVVLDDVLMTFDNTRVGAALEVMAELSEQCQVIVLSHQEDLGRVATALGNPAITVVGLEPAQPMRSMSSAEEVRAHARTTAAAPAPASPRMANSGDIRAWARQNGYDVADRGKLPSEVKEAYDAAHR